MSQSQKTTNPAIGKSLTYSVAKIDREERLKPKLWALAYLAAHYSGDKADLRQFIDQLHIILRCYADEFSERCNSQIGGCERTVNIPCSSDPTDMLSVPIGFLDETLKTANPEFARLTIYNGIYVSPELKFYRNFDSWRKTLGCSEASLDTLS